MEGKLLMASFKGPNKILYCTQSATAATLSDYIAPKQINFTQKRKEIPSPFSAARQVTERLIFEIKLSDMTTKKNDN